MDNTQFEFGLKIARQLVEANDDDWPNRVEQLRRDRKLSVAVRQINALTRHVEHRDEAIRALKRIGLWHPAADEQR